MNGMLLERIVARLPGATMRGPGGRDVAGISFDSREVADGDLFCCVPGFTVDGHDFAATAVERGAAALLVEREVPDVAVPQVVVDSVRAAMGPAASAVFADPSLSLDVVGVTGTNGKTTTAMMVAAICEAAGQAVGLTGTVQTRIAGVVEPVRHTTPEAPEVHLLLARMRDAGCHTAVMEVSSHALDQERVGGVRFKVGAFTNLTQDHLDYHHTLEEYFAAKKRLFDPARCDIAVLNTGDAYGARLASETGCARVLTYDVSGGRADVTAAVLEATPASLDVLIRGPFGEVRSRVGIGGRFNAANAACAATCAAALGLGADPIERGLASLRPVPGRFEPVSAGQDFGVIVDYAHTPDGVTNVVAAAREVAGPAAVIVVVGCGGDRDRAKRPLMGAAAATGTDHVILTADNPRSEDPRLIIDEMIPGVTGHDASWEVEQDRRLAIRLALQRARAGDMVVIAGKGHESGQEASGVVTPFDDRAVAREELERLAGMPRTNGGHA